MEKKQSPIVCTCAKSVTLSINYNNVQEDRFQTSGSPWFWKEKHQNLQSSALVNRQIVRSQGNRSQESRQTEWVQRRSSSTDESSKPSQCD